MEGIGKGPWTMKCPACKVDMITEEVEVPGPNIMIDRCPECGGVWYDKGELNKILKSKVPERFLKRTKGFTRWGKKRCPRCAEETQIKFVEEIEVDECTNCHGIWLDRGELGQLKDKDLDSMVDARLSQMLRGLRDGIKKKL